MKKRGTFCFCIGGTAKSFPGGGLRSVCLEAPTPPTAAERWNCCCEALRRALMPDSPGPTSMRCRILLSTVLRPGLTLIAYPTATMTPTSPSHTISKRRAVADVSAAVYSAGTSLLAASLHSVFRACPTGMGLVLRQLHGTVWTPFRGSSGAVCRLGSAEPGLLYRSTFF